MLSSTLSPQTSKFLLDENVKQVLFKFLLSKSFDVIFVPKATKDSQVAIISKKEKRILITNDWDFEWYTKNQVYSVIILKIPQNDSRALITSFEKLLKEFNKFSGRIVVLEVNKWHDFLLGEVT